MIKESFDLDGRTLRLNGDETPEILFLQPADAGETLPEETMRSCGMPFMHAAFEVKDWNRDLSPWEAPPVFGKSPFGGGASDTLAFLTERLLPELRVRLGLREGVRLCIGGYSLAGLFALWAASRTEIFDAVAAASPSVWFPGWLDYCRENPLHAKNVYLSLGDREERTKNPVMARVGDCIREMEALLRSDHTVTLEWNPGGHFQDPAGRTARAFCRAAALLRQKT